MTFRYAPIPVSPPAVSLGGRASRPQPQISVTLVGPLASLLRDGLLDTGSDEVVFRESDAARAGIDLTNGPSSAHSGAGGAPHAVRYARATLRVSDGREHREWEAWVGFTAAPLRRPLLGYASFLRFFTATFHGDREEVELAANPLYPGR